jgi:hypothetical protein
MTINYSGLVNLTKNACAQQQARVLGQGNGFVDGMMRRRLAQIWSWARKQLSVSPC